jgi:rRNA maturation protein Nop10
MPIPFTCPYCGETTLVDEPFAGHTGPCVNCGKLVTVPSAPQRYSIQSAVQKVQRTNWRAAVVIGVLLVGLGIAFFAFYQSIGKPAIVAAQQAAAKRTCANNLRQIGQALLAYEAQYGSFPPAYTVDAAGKPMHSWRALILPFLGPTEMALHRQLDMNRPWDAPENLLVARHMPKVFASPLDANSLSAQESNYVVIVGPETMFPGAQGRKRAEITDDVDSTLMVVEVKTIGKSWLEPVDLSFGSTDFQVGRDIGGNHHHGSNVLMADGDVHFLYNSTPKTEVEAMTTVAGGEQVSVDDPGN